MTATALRLTPPHDRGAAICAALVFVVGVAAVALRGALESERSFSSDGSPRLPRPHPGPLGAHRHRRGGGQPELCRRRHRRRPADPAADDPAPGTPVEPVPDPIRGVFLCSRATPPVPGVHGRCGELAALAASGMCSASATSPTSARPGCPAPRPFPPPRGNATTIRAERARARAQAFSSRPGGLTWPCP
jgi:hypothetical protein